MSISAVIVGVGQGKGGARVLVHWGSREVESGGAGSNSVGTAGAAVLGVAEEQLGRLGVIQLD